LCPPAFAGTCSGTCLTLNHHLVSERLHECLCFFLLLLVCSFVHQFVPLRTRGAAQSSMAISTRANVMPVQDAPSLAGYQPHHGPPASFVCAGWAILLRIDLLGSRSLSIRGQ
jgi:hypothetical protein